MRSKIIFPLMFGLVLAVAMASVAFSQDPPSDVEFNRPENALKTKFPPVAFDHGTHEAVADSCTDCHHTWDEESEIKPCSASGCHDNMTDRHLATSYFRAFHFSFSSNLLIQLTAP